MKNGHVAINQNATDFRDKIRKYNFGNKNKWEKNSMTHLQKIYKKMYMNTQYIK